MLCVTRSCKLVESIIYVTDCHLAAIYLHMQLRSLVTAVARLCRGKFAIREELRGGFATTIGWTSAELAARLPLDIPCADVGWL